MKTFSDIVFSEEKTINNINSKEKIMLSLTNNNLGENVFKKTNYTNLMLVVKCAIYYSLSEALRK